MTIYELSRRWDAMLSKGDIWVNSIERTDEQLMDVNRYQLQHGMGSDGKPLPEYRNYKMADGMQYRDMKMQMNPDNEGRFDMNRTGESLQKMHLSVDGVTIHITSLGVAQEWDVKLGGDVFGIYGNSALESYRSKFLYPVIINEIRLATGLK